MAVGEPLAGAQYIAMSDNSPEPFDFGQASGSVKLVSFPGAQVQEIKVGRHNWLGGRI